jgi:hypothetical protein
MMSFRGQAGWAEMMSLGDKLTSLGYQLTNKVNNGEELNYLSPNIGANLIFASRDESYLKFNTI